MTRPRQTPVGESRENTYSMPCFMDFVVRFWGRLKIIKQYKGEPKSEYCSDQQVLTVLTASSSVFTFVVDSNDVCFSFFNCFFFFLVSTASSCGSMDRLRLAAASGAGAGADGAAGSWVDALLCFTGPVN